MSDLEHDAEDLGRRIWPDRRAVLASMPRRGRRSAGCSRRRPSQQDNRNAEERASAVTEEFCDASHCGPHNAPPQAFQTVRAMHRMLP